MGQGSFENEINQTIEEIIAQDKKRINKAYNKIKREIEKKIEDIIQRDMINNYYNGYDPHYYQRTYQLPNSIAPLILDESTDSTSQFSFGIKITPPKGPSAMKHVKVIMFGRKAGRFRPNEQIIFNNFMEGIHPNENPDYVTSTPTTPVFDTANEALDKLFTDGTIDKIIQEVFSK